MHLRDTFAAHVAAALAARIDRPEHIAVRAYDIAEALVLERARRGHGDVDGEGAYEPEEFAALERAAAEARWTGAALLDEPMPMSERDEEVDPAWADLAAESPQGEPDPKWGPLFETTKKPGLKRTTPPAVEDLLRKKA